MNTTSEPRAVTEVDEVIGERIRARRTELGLPLAHVAEEVGIAYQQLQKYEVGQNRVSAATLTRLAEVLQVEPVDLLPPRGKARRAGTVPSGDEDGMALQLMRAYARIESSHERRLILDLTKRLADSAAGPKKTAARKRKR